MKTKAFYVALKHTTDIPESAIAECRREFGKRGMVLIEAPPPPPPPKRKVLVINFGRRGKA